METVFGDIKRDFGFSRFTPRGLDKCAPGFRLVAAGHNIRKLHAFEFPKPEERHMTKEVGHRPFPQQAGGGAGPPRCRLWQRGFCYSLIFT